MTTVRPLSKSFSSQLLVSVAIIIILTLAGCSHYGFSPSVKTHLSTVAVPILGNETLEFGVEQDLTDAIIREFTNDNSLRVVGEEEADSILRGAIVAYERPVMSYDAGGNPREYKVRIVARLTYEDLRKKLTVWEGEIDGWAVYSVDGEGGSLTTEQEARVAAVVKLGQDVLAQTVQGW